MALQSLPQASQQTTSAWTIDPVHSSADFAVRHLMVSTVRGTFRIRSGRVVLDEADLARSSVEAEVDVASVSTGVADRDAHLRSPDFFDAATHPTMRFVSTRVVPRGREHGFVEGDLTIRGITRPVTFEVRKDGETGAPGSRRGGLIAEATIDRADFGLTWNQLIETGGVVVGDRVRITLNLSGQEQA